MAREFAKRFYKSKAWKEIRSIVFIEANGVCQRCGEPGEEVHHIIWLTPNNIDDVDITLGLDNLILLCKDCHRGIHAGRSSTKKEYRFNENGELIPINR